MVTCKIDSAIPKMNRSKRPSSNSSGFRLLDADQLDTISSLSRNSIYKLKIDSMFDDSRSVMSHRLDRGSQRSGSIVLYGNRRLLEKKIEEVPADPVQEDVRRMSNSVQAQIEKMFTDVAKDADSSSFSVRCLGSLPLKDKVTSLQGLQDPLRQLYLSDAGQGNQNTGELDICANGLRVKFSADHDVQITPFHNIAVWSAVKFVVSASEGGAAFLPLITDPENIDKSTLFRPLTAADQRRLSSGLHAPIFAVVMRSASAPKLLECLGFVCHTPEDAIVIAATLYQSLMAHVGVNPNNSTRRGKPRNQNGVSCISIASSSALAKPINNSVGLKNTPNNAVVHSTTTQPAAIQDKKLPPVPSRPPRKKRTATSSLSGDSDVIREIVETTTEERKKKSHKTRRAPPIPTANPAQRASPSTNGELYSASMSYLDKQSRARNPHLPKDIVYHDPNGGDILTRVAIPRSGSFLNTGGLTRYKSRATRRHMGKSGGGGGGSPLGFSELFNEFRLHENLHSLDDILNAIIDADGMSFNDLKPIYKEFLLKLAVTLTKDELYQRSKQIMRKQKKKKLKRRNSTVQKKNKGGILSSKGLKKVFWFSKFRTNKSSKSQKSTLKSRSADHIGTECRNKEQSHRNHRTGTSGSDVSENRHENTLNGLNRNSSSGYVSCSECSYDSEACTCTSADRCYCSLGADHDHVNEKLTKPGVRDSLLSCKTEDKCYCSLGEPNTGESSDTTWCDSDSCISTSKCYCKRNQNNNVSPVSKTKGPKPRNNMALDYELFTVGGAGKAVKAHEALSVKKSVEVAAVFADVKLSQTTDIKSLQATNKSNTSSRRLSTSSSNKSKERSSSKTELKSSSTNDLLSRLDSIEKPILRKTTSSSSRPESCYQSMRRISASLEDSLGYLP